MLFSAKVWPGLTDGSVTVAFRRWKRPSVKAGGTLQSPGGLLAITEVAPIDVADITTGDAHAAGYESIADVVADLRADGELYRVRFRRVSDDPRIALREQADVDDALLTAVKRLPWAVDVLAAIADQPATVSTVLAAQLGLERQPFKLRVRRLKSLGLTESLEVGYRLSPRGKAVFDKLT